MPLNQIAQVHSPESQLITVQPFDPTQLAAIEKAIRSAELGLNPMNDGKIIRVPVPPLTEERRREMVKHLHKVNETLNYKPKQECDEFTGPLSRMELVRIYLRVVIFS